MSLQFRVIAGRPLGVWHVYESGEVYSGLANRPGSYVGRVSRVVKPRACSCCERLIPGGRYVVIHRGEGTALCFACLGQGLRGRVVVV